MRLLFVFIAGILIAPFFFNAVQTGAAKVKKPDPVSGRGDSVFVFVAQLVHELPPDPLPSDIMMVFNDAIPYWKDCTWDDPNSANTNYHWLTVWPEGDAVIIETSSTCPGSCGMNIFVCKYNPDSASWELMFETCGGLDTVFPISHNGLRDFSVEYRWNPTLRYQYDGSEYHSFEEMLPQSDSDQVVAKLAELLGYGSYIGFSYQMNYVVLDSADVPYILAQDGICGQYLFHEEEPGRIELISSFKAAAQIDILKAHHNGMPDIRAVTCGMKNDFYRWNGKTYVLYSSEEWHCPA